MPDPPLTIAAVWTLAWETQQATYTTRHHGLDHWVRVERNGLWLAERVEGVDVAVVRHFAALHDCQRRDDGHDPDHGPRAADFLHTLTLDLTGTQLDLLALAIRTHTRPDLHREPTIQVCHDADRLDLGRVFITPRPRFLNTTPARELAARRRIEELDRVTERLDLTRPDDFRPTPV